MTSLKVLLKERFYKNIYLIGDTVRGDGWSDLALDLSIHNITVTDLL